MDCPEVRERLPWHLNGSLEPDERDAVRRHLEGCAACQEELRDSRNVASAFAAHPTASAIVDLAWDRPTPGLDPAALRVHVEDCPTCSQELADARESRRGADTSEAASKGAANPTFWRAGSLAAALVVGLAAGFLLRDAGSPAPSGLGDAERDRLARQLAQLNSEAADLRSREAELRGRLEGLAAPQANLPVVELTPGSGTTRSAAGGAPNEIALPQDAPLVALVIDSSSRSRGPRVAEVRSEDGALLWRVTGLNASPLGGYTLGLPASRLPEGTLTLVVAPEDGRGASERYLLRVRKTR